MQACCESKDEVKGGMGTGVLQDRMIKEKWIELGLPGRYYCSALTVISETI